MDSRRWNTNQTRGFDNMKIKFLALIVLLSFPFSSYAATGQGIFSWTAQTESLQDADLLPITDVSDTTQSTSGSSKKITASQLKTYVDADKGGAAVLDVGTTAGTCLLY